MASGAGKRRGQPALEMLEHALKKFLGLNKLPKLLAEVALPDSEFVSTTWYREHRRRLHAQGVKLSGDLDRPLSISTTKEVMSCAQFKDAPASVLVDLNDTIEYIQGLKLRVKKDRTLSNYLSNLRLAVLSRQAYLEISGTLLLS